MINKNYIKLIIILTIITFTRTYSITGLVNFTVTQSNNPSPGYFFMAPVSDDHIQMVDNAGMPGPNTQSTLLMGGYDFNLQNNKMTFYYQDYFSGKICYFGMNSNFEVTDTFACKNYKTDFHDFRLLPNGHRIFIGVDYRTIDMSPYINGGSTTARVSGYVVQEQDGSGNTVFEWNSFDHYNIMDATEDIDLTMPAFDACHINSFTIDVDGNYLISARHLDEITKVDRNTGTIIWRLGGSKCKNNQFTFINDTRNNFTGFSHQHSLVVLPNGHLLMFDNGNLKPSPFSRAVEYELDQNAKTITKVWEYYKTPSVYSVSMGNVQRLPNGNTLIGWGSIISGSPLVATEVDQNGNVAFEMTHSSLQSYRVYKYIYKMSYIAQMLAGVGNYDFNDYNNPTSVSLAINTPNIMGKVGVERHYYQAYNMTFSGTVPPNIYNGRWVVQDSGIQNIGGTIKFDLARLSNSNRFLGIYYRQKEGSGDFAYLPTTYNSSNNTINATFAGPGEYILGQKMLDPPVLVSPADSSDKQPVSGLLKWYKYPDMSYYSVQVSQFYDFHSIIVDSSNISDSSLVYHLQPATVYYWRVKASSEISSTSWSAPFQFTTLLPAPELVYPANNANGQIYTPQFSWGKIDKATSYIVQISGSNNFSTIDREITVIPNMLKLDTALEGNSIYYWRVMAISNNIKSDWSTVFRFATALEAPTLVFPQNQMIDLPKLPTLSWNNSGSGYLYRIQISDSKNFYNILQDFTDISDTTVKPFKLGYNSLFFWRVMVYNKDNFSFWSDVYSFSTVLAPPIQDLPLDNSRNLQLTVNFKWEPVDAAVSYRLQIARDSSFKTLVAFVNDTVSSSFTYTHFAYDTKYYWRVSAKSKTAYGDWSDIYSFATRQEFYLSNPTGNQPANNKFNTALNIDFLWDLVPGANGYNFEVSTDSSFNNSLIIANNLTETNYTYPSFEYNKNYYWRVQAYNDKAISDWSPVMVFHTKLDLTKILTPANGDTNITIGSSFTWKSVDGAAAYSIQLSKTEDFTLPVQLTSNQTNLILQTNLDQNSQYYWHVKAVNGQKESDWSDTGYFFTPKVTSVNDNSDRFSAEFYPLPANDFLTLKVQDIQSDIIDVCITNSLGQTILNLMNLSCYQGMTVYNIPIDGFNSGVYFYKITLQDKIITGCIPVIK